MFSTEKLQKANKIHTQMAKGGIWIKLHFVKAVGNFVN